MCLKCFSELDQDCLMILDERVLSLLYEIYAADYEKNP
jgi:hypothetical protein